MGLILGILGLGFIITMSSYLISYDRTSNAQIKQNQKTSQGDEILIYPKEFNIFKDYIEVIGGRPSIGDTGTIEGTVISLTKSSICPYKEEKCRIEPYPKDFGVVRVDRVINYTSYSEQTEQRVVEEQGEGIEETLKTTPGYKGQDVPSKQIPNYEPLQAGRNIESFFLLTARPAKIRYVPIKKPKSGIELIQTSETNIQTVTHKSGEEKKTFEPIPKDKEYFVFTTKIGDFPRTIEKTLVGLREGSKFRAEISYNGVLYIEEYEVIK